MGKNALGGDKAMPEEELANAHQGLEKDLAWGYSQRARRMKKHVTCVLGRGVGVACWGSRSQ